MGKASDKAFILLWQIRVEGLEAPFRNGLEAHWTHWLEASVTGKVLRGIYQSRTKPPQSAGTGFGSRGRIDRGLLFGSPASIFAG